MDISWLFVGNASNTYDGRIDFKRIHTLNTNQKVFHSVRPFSVVVAFDSFLVAEFFSVCLFSWNANTINLKLR